jgi:hypothetical protein
MEGQVNLFETDNNSDMANDPAFLFYPGDYLRDTQCLSEACQVAYDRIMCEHMRNISEDMNNIRVTQQKLNFFSKRLSTDEKDELLAILTPIEDGFQIKWVAESICKRKSYSDSRRENRLGKNKNTSLSYDGHMENENENENVEKVLNVPFLDFWNLYDKKVGDKGKLARKWASLKNSDREAIMRHIPVYKIAQPDKTYRKHPGTYLNNKSWLDEEIIYSKNKLNGRAYFNGAQSPTAGGQDPTRINEEDVGDL